MGSIGSYCYHGSDCPIIRGLKNRYGQLAKHSGEDLSASRYCWPRYSSDRQTNKYVLDPV